MVVYQLGVLLNRVSAASKPSFLYRGCLAGAIKMKSAKQVAAYWAPPVALEILSYLRLGLRYRHLKGYLAQNHVWHDRYLGDEVYVIANGPSLNNFRPDRLYGKNVIVMNHFELSTWKSRVNIVAHCLGEPFDSSAWEDPTASIFGTEAQSYWMHISAAADSAVQECLAHKPIHFVQAIIKPRLWRARTIDLTRSTLGYQTTAQLAISVALYLGFKSINLLGFDHDWLGTRSHSPHFYDENAAPPANLAQFSYYELITISGSMWEFYFALSRIAREVNAHIVNLSDPSYLDVFPRRADFAS